MDIIIFLALLLGSLAFAMYWSPPGYLRTVFIEPLLRLVGRR